MPIVVNPGPKMSFAPFPCRAGTGKGAAKVPIRAVPGLRTRLSPLTVNGNVGKCAAVQAVDLQIFDHCLGSLEQYSGKIGA